LRTDQDAVIKCLKMHLYCADKMKIQHKSHHHKFLFTEFAPYQHYMYMNCNTHYSPSRTNPKIVWWVQRSIFHHLYIYTLQSVLQSSEA
jgi:hypothetical protein